MFQDIDSGVRRVYHIPLAFKCIYGCIENEVKIGVGRRREVGECLLSYADDLVLCGESEEHLRAVMECFV